MSIAVIGGISVLNTICAATTWIPSPEPVRMIALPAVLILIAVMPCIVMWTATAFLKMSVVIT